MVEAGGVAATGPAEPYWTDRASTGLPEGAFVFCNFNNPEKFERVAFASWMRILARVERSVLWLSEFDNPAIAANLRMFAMANGIDPARLDCDVDNVGSRRTIEKNGGVFDDDFIDSYIELKMTEVIRFEHTPHPVEFDMYYSA